MSLISGNAIFGGDAVNCSSNSISGSVVFFGTATNAGDVTSAVFNDGAVNCGSIISGVFLGNAINSGSVSVAEFFGTASNAGFIVESAKFADTSSNVGTVSGSAIFADTSVSNGIVQGAVQIAQTATQGESQALTETPTEYTQTDGFFANAYYDQGVKTAPVDYATVVHQVGNFWYKYDNSGTGSLANGFYSDGSLPFKFINGIKGSLGPAKLIVHGATYYYLGSFAETALFTNEQLTVPAANVIFELQGTGYVSDNSGLVVGYSISQVGNYYFAGSSISVGKILFTENTLENRAINLSGADVGDIDNDGYNDAVTTSSNGEITDIQYGSDGGGGGKNGAYSDGYFLNDSIDTNYFNSTPQTAIDDQTKYYVYSNGTASLANGRYSNGAFVNGVLDTTYSQSNPETAIDGGAYYYTAGAASSVSFSCILINGSYYYYDVWQDGKLLFCNTEACGTFANLCNYSLGDMNSDGIHDYLSTNNLGQIIINEGKCINGVGYYTGCLQNGNSLYNAADFSLPFTLDFSAKMDVNNDGINDCFCIDASNGYKMNIEFASCTCLGGCNFYYTGNNIEGILVYPDASLCVAYPAGFCINIGDYNNDQIDDYLCVNDANGLAYIVCGI